MSDIEPGVGGEDTASLEDRYWAWVKIEAQKINSDGCSKSKDWQVHCCYEHDLACHYGKDPRKAVLTGWANAPKISRRDADKAFTGCNLKYSKGFVGTTRSLLRYLGVRIGSLWPF
jgi:hypothetical protein